MNEELKSAILKLKHEIHEAERAYQKGGQLVALREELERREQELLDQFHSDHLRMHQKLAYCSDEAACLSEKDAQQQELLHQLKRKKQEIDTFLDNLEEHSEDTIRRLKEKLIEFIIQVYPEEESIYHQLKGDLEHSMACEKDLADCVTMTKQLSHFLESAITVRQSVKRKGILSYILGVNPNINITQFLQAAESLASSSLPILSEKASDERLDVSLRELSKEMHAFLQKFQLDCKSQWSFNRIDTIFTDALEKIQGYQKNFETEWQRQNIKTKKRLEKLNVWIDEH